MKKFIYKMMAKFLSKEQNRMCEKYQTVCIDCPYCFSSSDFIHYCRLHEAECCITNIEENT